MLHFIEIPSHPHYLINKVGEVYNTKFNRKLKASLTSSSGYYTVYVDGKNKLLHRLIAEVFIPNPDNLPCVNHIDGNKLNNDISNLEWCTHAYNNKHAYETGLKKYPFTGGENSAHRKLTESEVNFIKENYKKYDAVYGGRALAKKFDVSESCISAIILGKSWGGV